MATIKKKRAASAAKEYFSKIPQISYEGPTSKNPWAFKWYNPEELVEGKTMAEHLRFSVVYWHTFRGTGADPFGMGTMLRPWDDGTDSIENAQKRIRVAFQFMEKLGNPFWAFHDRDIAPEGSTLRQTNKNLDAVVKVAKEEMKRTGIKLLWGTSNLFGNPRYMHGAATSCNADAFAYAAAQVKRHGSHPRAGRRRFHLLGRPRGYPLSSIRTSNASLITWANSSRWPLHTKRKSASRASSTSSPNQWTTKHQYDSDAAACLNFLRQYGLLRDFKLNLETNHAILAGHTMHHEMETAASAGALGSLDANTGDPMLGWDTDQFPTSVYETSLIMYTLMKYGGFTTGGVNFDAKVRRESFTPEDLFSAHIGGMDAFARGLKIAAAMRADGRLADFIKNRYASWDSGIGAEIEKGKVGFKELSEYMLKKGNVAPNASGRQEYLENMINEYIM